MSEILMKIDGQNGCAIAYKDKIILSRKGLKGFLAQGFSGDRTYYYKDITAIDFKKPTFWANGYLKILTAGIQDNNKEKVNFSGITEETFKDPNTIALRAFDKKKSIEYEQFYTLLMQKIDETKNSKNYSMNSQSIADEIKKFKELLDIGAITQEEFDSKKKELLQK